MSLGALRGPVLVTAAVQSERCLGEEGSEVGGRGVNSAVSAPGNFICCSGGVPANAGRCQLTREMGRN